MFESYWPVVTIEKGVTINIIEPMGTDGIVAKSTTRKAIILAALSLTGLILIIAGGAVGLQESSLPSEVRLDELRLLEPQRLTNYDIPTHVNDFDAPEVEVQRLTRCFDGADPNVGTTCVSILSDLLRAHPANGRLWLEMARLLSRNEGALDSDALLALKHSYEYAPREDWITRKRTAFVVSVWPGLSSELQLVATQEIAEALSDPNYVAYLAGIYKDNPMSRAVISALITNVSKPIQQSFMRTLSQEIAN